MFAITLAVICIPMLTNGYRMFQSRIPNGDKIPHPCLNEAWQGVGHESPAGGGPRNPFGIDFFQNDKVWNRTLCEADSDGDGKSNGVELGDPDCIWSPAGPAPSQNTGLSHPGRVDNCKPKRDSRRRLGKDVVEVLVLQIPGIHGICEPLNSQMCAGKTNFEISCQAFSCPATENPVNSHFRVHFENSVVPQEETSYHCLSFAFPNDTDYYMLAYEPIVNNSNVLHHLVIYGCNEDAKIDENDLNKPYNCFMGDREGCNEILAVWALGIDGYCFPEGVGLKVGKTGFKKAILEVHWTNPMKTAGYRDSSGLDVTITSVQQPKEAGVLMIGQGEMFIPPNTMNYPVEGICPAYCTEQFMSGEIQVFSVFNHMHYLGQSIRSSVIAPNAREDNLAYDIVYDYNRPLMHTLTPARTVRPGDELKLHCDFNSTTRNTTTKWGLGTFDEMCYSFLFYYPANRMSVTQCVTTGIFEECQNPEAPNVHNGCDFVQVFNISRKEVQERYTKVPQLCDHHRCLKECKDYLRELFQDPCHSRENRPYLKQAFYGFPDNRIEIREYWSLLQSCDWELAQEEIMVPRPPPGGTETSAAGVHVLNVLVTIGLFSSVTLFL